VFVLAEIILWNQTHLCYLFPINSLRYVLQFTSITLQLFDKYITIKNILIIMWNVIKYNQLLLQLNPWHSRRLVNPGCVSKKWLHVGRPRPGKTGTRVACDTEKHIYYLHYLIKSAIWLWGRFHTARLSQWETLHKTTCSV